MTKNYRIIALAFVNVSLAFLCGVSFGPWLPWLSGRDAPGNFFLVFILLVGFSVLVMIVRRANA